MKLRERYIVFENEVDLLFRDAVCDYIESVSFSILMAEKMLINLNNIIKLKKEIFEKEMDCIFYQISYAKFKNIRKLREMINTAYNQKESLEDMVRIIKNKKNIYVSDFKGVIDDEDFKIIDSMYITYADVYDKLFDEEVKYIKRYMVRVKNANFVNLDEVKMLKGVEDDILKILKSLKNIEAELNLTWIVDLDAEKN